MNPLVFLVAIVYCLVTPFTKVEESFNVQAIHDILFHRFNISLYDHNEFPGVVPRTFLGPLAISIVAAPLVALMEMCELNKFWSQYIVRLTLAGFIVFAWSKLKTTLQQKLGTEVAVWFTLITISQFHFMFYMTRPLPNILALPLVLLSVNSWLRREIKRFFLYAGAAILIFRAELVILLGLFLLYDIFFKRITIKELLIIGAPTGIFLIFLTVSIDSFMWGRLLWPEAEVFWYNTILNKSSDWGTSPFLWYFYSALPRAMGFSLIFVPFGLMVEPRIRSISVPAFMFVLIYSILPHKELRFIIYVFPLLNVAAACSCQRIWNNRDKSKLQFAISFVAGGHLVGNFLLTVFLLTVSGTNYPGGVAMSRLHRIAAGETNISVHIDNLAAQSGVSRFTQINDNWIYSKDETLKAGDEDLHQFTYLLTEVKNKYSPEMKLLQQTHDKVELIECFSNIGIHYKSLLPVKIRTKPCIMIMKRRSDAVLVKDMIFDDLQENPEIQEMSGDKSLEFEDENEIEEQELDIVSEQEGENTIELSKVKKLRKRKLKPFNNGMKQKIKDIIEQELKADQMAEKEAKEAHDNIDNIREEKTDESENIESEEAHPKSSIKKIIKIERTKQLKEEISKLDLSQYCNLKEMDTKDCLKKIIDEYNDEF